MQLKKPILQKADLLFHLINRRNAFALILIVSITLSFIKLGGESVADWDEARNGVNAFEMLKNHDFINLYYNQQLDTWNNKPPLLIWLICLSYKVFGFNEFALRFPSAIATIIFFIFFFKTICLYEKPLFAVLACAILFSTKGIIGPHAGRSGDFDALLICFLMTGAYYFLRYSDEMKPILIYLTSVFLGLAFLTKGTASLYLVPGFLIYLFFQKKIKIILINRHTVFAILLYLIFIAGWIFSVTNFGKTYAPESSEYHSHNAVETLFIHDTVNRLTNHLFESGYDHHWTYFLSVIDAKLNLWNYLFYLALIVLLLKLFKFKLNSFTGIFSIRNNLFLFSIVQAFTLGLILTLAVNKLTWYLAPVFPFIAIVITFGAKYFYYSFRSFKIILFGLILFTFSRQFIYLCQPNSELKNFFLKYRDKIKSYNNIYIVNQPSQSYFLYLEWTGKNILPRYEVSENNMPGGKSLVCINKENPAISKFKIIDCFDNYCLTSKPSGVWYFK